MKCVPSRYETPEYCGIHRDILNGAVSIEEVWASIEESQASQSFSNSCTNCRQAFMQAEQPWDCAFWRGSEWQP
jgi:hypothetical protein